MILSGRPDKDPGRNDESNDAPASRVAAAPANLIHSSSSDGVHLMVFERARAAKTAAAHRAADRDKDTGYESSGSSIPAVDPKMTAKSAG